MSAFWVLLAGLIIGAAAGGRVGWLWGLDEGAKRLLDETAKVNKLLNAIGALSAMAHAYKKWFQATDYFTGSFKTLSDKEATEAGRVVCGFADAIIQADNVEEEIRRKAQRGS